jgi:hypothetical protein
MTENQTQAAPDAIRAARYAAAQDCAEGLDEVLSAMSPGDPARQRTERARDLAGTLLEELDEHYARLAALEAALEAADHLAGFVDVSTIRASRDAEWGNRLAAYRTARYRAG